MQDAPKSEAQAFAASIVAEYGEPKSRETLLALLAVAYSRGALAAATESLEVSQRA